MENLDLIEQPGSIVEGIEVEQVEDPELRESRRTMLKKSLSLATASSRDFTSSIDIRMLYGNISYQMHNIQPEEIKSLVKGREFEKILRYLMNRMKYHYANFRFKGELIYFMLHEVFEKYKANLHAISSSALDLKKDLLMASFAISTSENSASIKEEISELIRNNDEVIIIVADALDKIGIDSDPFAHEKFTKLTGFIENHYKKYMSFYSKLMRGLLQKTPLDILQENPETSLTVLEFRTCSLIGHFRRLIDDAFLRSIFDSASHLESSVKIIMEKSYEHILKINDMIESDPSILPSKISDHNLPMLSKGLNISTLLQITHRRFLHTKLKIPDGYKLQNDDLRDFFELYPIRYEANSGLILTALESKIKIGVEDKECFTTIDVF